MVTNSSSNIPTAASGKVLQGAGVGTNNTFSTATYPSTATGTGKILIADGTNWIASTPTYPSGSGTSGKVLISDGTNNVYSTPTFPNASATSGKFIRSDGTNWIASTPTLPTSAGTSGKVLQSDGTNYVESTPTYPSTSGSSGKILVSDGTNNIYSTPTFPNASATSRKIIVSDGTNWVASTETWATPGTSGNVLKSDGTNWTSAANSGVGNLVLIQSQTASNSATLSFTTGITSTYTTYFFVVSNAVPVTDGQKLQLLFSTDGGSSYAATNYKAGINTFLNYNSATITNANTTTFIPVSESVSSTAPGASAQFYIYNVTNGNKPAWNGMFTLNYSVGPQTGFGFLGGTSTNTTVNAFRFQFGSGNISTGIFTLFGVKES